MMVQKITIQTITATAATITQAPPATYGLRRAFTTLPHYGMRTEAHITMVLLILPVQA